MFQQIVTVFLILSLLDHAFPGKVTIEMVNQLEDEVLDDPLRWGDIKGTLAFLDLTRVIRIHAYREHIYKKEGNEKRKSELEDNNLVETYMIVAGMVKYLEGGEKAFNTEIVPALFDDITSLFDVWKEKIRSCSASSEDKNIMLERINNFVTHAKTKCGDQSEAKTIEHENDVLEEEMKKLLGEKPDLFEED